MTTTTDVWLKAELYENPGGAEQVYVWVYANDGVTKLGRFDLTVRDLGLLTTGQLVLSLMAIYAEA